MIPEWIAESVLEVETNRNGYRTLPAGAFGQSDLGAFASAPTLATAIRASHEESQNLKQIAVATYDSGFDPTNREQALQRNQSIHNLILDLDRAASEEIRELRISLKQVGQELTAAHTEAARAAGRAGRSYDPDTGPVPPYHEWSAHSDGVLSRQAGKVLVAGGLAVGAAAGTALLLKMTILEDPARLTEQLFEWTAGMAVGALLAAVFKVALLLLGYVAGRVITIQSRLHWVTSSICLSVAVLLTASEIGLLAAFIRHGETVMADLAGSTTSWLDSLLPAAVIPGAFAVASFVLGMLSGRRDAFFDENDARAGILSYRKQMAEEDLECLAAWSHVKTVRFRLNELRAQQSQLLKDLLEARGRLRANMESLIGLTIKDQDRVLKAQNALRDHATKVCQLVDDALISSKSDWPKPPAPRVNPIAHFLRLLKDR